MFFHILLLALIGSSYTQPNFHTFIGKYATLQIFSTCFGEAYMTEYYNNYTEARSFCRSKSPDEYLAILSQNPAVPHRYGIDSNDDQINSNYDDINEQILKALQLLPDEPDYTMMDFGPQSPNSMNEMFNLAQLMMQMQGGSAQPILMMPLSQDVMSSLQGVLKRQKRSTQLPYFDEEKITKFYESVRSKAGNFTCMMRKLNIYDANFQLNEDYLVKKVLSKTSDPVLITDLTECVTDCARYSECKPSNRMNFIPESVQRATAFLKCQIKQELAACVKNDLMKKQHKFDKNALDKLPGDLDDGDKMYALLFGDLSKNQ